MMLWSHMTNLKSNTQKLKLFPSNLTVTQNKVQEYSQEYTNIQQPTNSLAFNQRLLAIFVFYCCIINYQKCSDLKQHPFIILQFCRSESRWADLYSAKDLTRLTSLCLPDKTLILEALKKYLLPSSFGLLADSRFLQTQDW